MLETAAEADSPSPYADSAARGPAVTATAVVLDRAGRVLLLAPAAPPAAHDAGRTARTRDAGLRVLDTSAALPGTAVSALETPEDALARALRDVLGPEVTAGRLLAVDSAPPGGAGRARLAHLYAAGPLTDAQAAAATAPDGESAARWLDREAAAGALPPHAARRLRAALDAWDTGAVAHLAGGEPQPGSSAGLPAGRRAELEHAAALDPSSYLAVRPHVIVGAGAVVRDAAGRVLLVRAAYRDDGRWQLPGGGVDSDLGETPRLAARRELREETGLDRPLGRLLAVDFTPRRPAPALVVYVYDGGVLGAGDLARIRVDGTEIADWRLAGPDEFDALLSPRGAAIAGACAGALEDGAGPLDLVAGRPA